MYNIFLEHEIGSFQHVYVFPWFLMVKKKVYDFINLFYFLSVLVSSYGISVIIVCNIVLNVYYF
jgi:hypothetical protein